MVHPEAKSLTATAWIRAMATANGQESGGSEPHVFETDHGGPHMVKVSNNPQGPRILLNELLGGLCMEWLGIDHPRPAIVHIPEEVITSSPQAKFNNGAVLSPGLAFGSALWQSDPQSAIDASLLANRDNVAATVAFDTWVPNGDGRQYRVRAQDEDPSRYDYIPIDQGHSFGHNWTTESMHASAVSPVVVAAAVVPLTMNLMAPSITRLREFNEDVTAGLVSQVPVGWWNGDERTAAREMLVARSVAAADALAEQYEKAPSTEVTS